MAKARKKSRPAKKSSKTPQNKAKSEVRLSAIILSTVQAGELLGVSDEWVRRLVKEGYIDKRSRNSVALKSAVEGYIKFLKDDARRSSKSAVAGRLQEAKAKQTEVRTAKEIGELVPFEESNALLQQVVGTMMAGLNGLPAQVTRDLDVRREIEAAIDGIRLQVAKSIEELGPDYADIGDFDPPESPGAAGSVGSAK